MVDLIGGIRMYHWDCCEKLMSSEAVMIALKECEEKWPEYEFRGHKPPMKVGYARKANTLDLLLAVKKQTRKSSVI